MTEFLRIRLAVETDLDEMVALAMAAASENAFLPPSPGHLAAEIWPALHQDHGLCAVIGPPDGAIEGAVLLRIGSMWYSDRTVIEEKAVFVRPDFRAAKGGRAARLCEFSKKVADSLQLPLIIGILSNSRTEAKVRLYERYFGAPAGAFFLYGAQTGVAAE